MIKEKKIRFISVKECIWNFYECLRVNDCENASSYFESLLVHYKNRGKEIRKLKLKQPKELTHKEWIKGYKEWKEQQKKIKPNGSNQEYTEEELKDRQEKGYSIPLNEF